MKIVRAVKRPSLEIRIMRYIENGIKENRFLIYRRNDADWYGIHLKKYLAPAVGVTPSKCLKVLRKLRTEKCISIWYQLWEKESWEIGIRFPG